MSQILGTVVAAIVTTGDTANTFAVVDQAEMRGGHHTVASLTARDAISSDRRTEGMTCWITTTAQLFRLVGGTANTNWVQEFTNNGTSSVSVDQVARNTANSALAGVNQVYPIAVSGTTMANLDAVWIGTLNTIVAGIVAGNNDPVARALAYSALVTAWWGTAGVAQAFNLASEGTNGANFAIYLASQGTNGVNQVYPIANAGTTGANFAIWLASQGTNGVNQVFPIANAGTAGANFGIFLASQGTNGVNQVFPIAVAGTTVANLDATWIGTLNTEVNNTITWIGTLNTAILAASSATKTVLMCNAFTPASTGADVGEIFVPFSSNGTSVIPWNVKRGWIRANVVETGTSVVIFEKSTVMTAFIPITMGTAILNAGYYEGTVTGTQLGTVNSGDKVRFNVAQLGAAQNWAVAIEISYP